MEPLRRPYLPPSNDRKGDGGWIGWILLVFALGLVYGLTFRGPV